MNDFIQERIAIENKAAAIMSREDEEKSALIRQIQQEAEEKSPFKKWQLVRVCRPGTLHLTTWKIDERPESDPFKYFDSRVMGWDMFGRIEVATEYGNNPHCSTWCWTEERVATRQDEDWFPKSSFKIDQEISFIWELPGFWNNEGLGKRVRAVIKGPHIKPGDWLVLYEKPSGDWIIRVLNEKQILPR